MRTHTEAGPDLFVDWENQPQSPAAWQVVFMRRGLAPVVLAEDLSEFAEALEPEQVTVKYPQRTTPKSGKTAPRAIRLVALDDDVFEEAVGIPPSSLELRQYERFRSISEAAQTARVAPQQLTGLFARVRNKPVEERIVKLRGMTLMFDQDYLNSQSGVD